MQLNKKVYTLTLSLNRPIFPLYTECAVCLTTTIDPTDTDQLSINAKRLATWLNAEWEKSQKGGYNNADMSAR